MVKEKEWLEWGNPRHLISIALNLRSCIDFVIIVNKVCAIIK